MTEIQQQSSIMRRLADINAEKVLRRSCEAWNSFRWGCERRLGITYPRWIDGISTSMTANEKQALFHFARRLPPGAALAEIGSFHGASSCCLAAGIQFQRGKLYCIDTWMNDAVSDACMDVFPVWQRHTSPMADSIQAVRGYSHVVIDRIPNELALLFVDGDHSYEGVRRDLLLYLPKLSKNCILIMHDWNHDSVRQAVSELVQPCDPVRLVLLPNLYSCRLSYRS